MLKRIVVGAAAPVLAIVMAMLITDRDPAARRELRVRLHDHDLLGAGARATS